MVCYSLSIVLSIDLPSVCVCVRACLRACPKVDLASDTVFTLKRKILSKEPVPVAVQKLVLDGRVLANNNDLLSASEGLIAGCTLNVAVGMQEHPVAGGGWRGNFYAKSTPCTVAQTEAGQVRVDCVRHGGCVRQGHTPKSAPSVLHSAAVFRVCLRVCGARALQCAFFGSLYCVANYLSDYGNSKIAAKVLTLLREVTGSVPLVAALSALVSRRSLSPAQKHAIVEPLYRLFRHIVPLPGALCVPVGTPVVDEVRYQVAAWACAQGHAAVGLCVGPVVVGRCASDSPSRLRCEVCALSPVRP